MELKADLSKIEDKALLDDIKDIRSSKNVAEAKRSAGGKLTSIADVQKQTMMENEKLKDINKGLEDKVGLQQGL